MKQTKIPNEWRNKYAYNCLTDEQYKLLQDTHDVDDEFPVNCDECGTYTLHSDHRCDCGNRRCYFQFHNGLFDVEVD